MSLITYATPFDEINEGSEIDKKRRNHTIKRPLKSSMGKLPNITFSDETDGLADFTPPPHPLIMKQTEPNVKDGSDMNEYIREGFQEEQSASNYPQKYEEKPMSKMQQHDQFMKNFKNYNKQTNEHSANTQKQGLDSGVTNFGSQCSKYYNSQGEEQSELNKKLSYMIQLLEEQKSVKTDGVVEDVILYSFLGVFMIFLAESFTKVGKYVR